MQFQKKFLCIAVFGLLMSVGCFAKTTGSIPTWMGNSIITLTKEAFGNSITINDWFGKTPKEATNVAITHTEKTLTIDMDMHKDDAIVLKVTVTFVFAKAGNTGTCYPSKLYYEVPLSFQSQTLTCKGPYNDTENCSMIIGLLQKMITWLYE